LLFTARRPDEGGIGSLTAAQRTALLVGVLDEAAAVDVEVASLGEMAPLLAELRRRQVPWIASWHDFAGLGEPTEIARACHRAAEAGAAVFKVAVMVREAADLPRLASLQAGPWPLPVAVMGMGPLGLVSRLLCAQYGSALQYGFLGRFPTAPGQWPAARLREAVRDLPQLR
jgi:3-dehydroquinate dehydratase type I